MKIRTQLRTLAVRLVAALLATSALLLPSVVGAPAALAACPVNKPDCVGGGGGGGGTQPPKPKYQLVFDKIHVVDLQDGDGWDEPIIKMDGVTKIANWAVQAGVSNLYQPIVKPSFTTWVNMEVREADPYWPDNAIATFTVYPPNPPTATGVPVSNWADVYGAGAHYRLHYTLTRI